MVTALRHFDRLLALRVFADGYSEVARPFVHADRAERVVRVEGDRASALRSDLNPGMKPRSDRVVRALELPFGRPA